MTEFKSYNSYYEFSAEVLNKSRYIYDKKTKIFINALIDTCENHDAELRKGSILFRAQRGCDKEPIFDQATNEHIADDDYPYKKERMFPLKEKSIEGRANPRGISYLYLSSDKNTACAEARPWKDSIISLGIFHVKKNIKIIDCSKVKKKFEFFLEQPEPHIKEECVWADINNTFSQPVNPNDPKTEYIPTQIIAEIIREQGYDGIAYKSSLEKGYNIVLFDFNAVEMLGCWLTKTKDIFFDFEHRKRGYGKTVIEKQKDKNSSYIPYNIIFKNNKPTPPKKITEHINQFGNAYKKNNS